MVVALEIDGAIPALLACGTKAGTLRADRTKRN
jgi:hypothetical protein